VGTAADSKTGRNPRPACTHYLDAWQTTGPHLHRAFDPPARFWVQVWVQVWVFPRLLKRDQTGFPSTLIPA